MIAFSLLHKYPCIYEYIPNQSKVVVGKTLYNFDKELKKSDIN